MRFKSHYFIGSVVLFLIELFIALHVRDTFIRPYVGDVLAVILLYSMARTFLKISILTTAISTLFLSFGIEILQYFKIVEILGLETSIFARTIIGTTFTWEDLIAYSIGIALVLCFERSLGIDKREWRSVE